MNLKRGIIQIYFILILIGQIIFSNFDWTILVRSSKSPKPPATTTNFEYYDNNIIQFMDPQIQTQFFTPPVDPQERIDTSIQFVSPIESVDLDHFSYVELQKRVLDTTERLFKTGYYNGIEVVMGATPQIPAESILLKERNRYQQEHYQLQILKLQKQIAYIKNAQSFDQLKKVDKIIDSNQHPRPNIRLRPKVLIKANKKFPWYGTLVQEVDKNGMGSFKAMVGYRGLCLMHDKLVFKYEKFITNANAQNYSLKWSNPLQNEGTQVGIEIGLNHNKICKDLDQKSKSVIIGYSDPGYRIDFQASQRTPILPINSTQNSWKFIRKLYIQPSSKYSVKGWKLLTNSLKQGSITTGNYADLSVEATVPYFSQSKFIKADLNLKKYVDLYAISKWFNNSVAKKLFRTSNLQTYFGLSTLFHKTHFVSDYLTPPSVRGFTNKQQPHPCQLQLKTSLKFNIYNYPIIQQGGIRAFLYWQNGLIFNKILQSKKGYSIIGSTGLGVNFPISQFANLQVVYALLQYQRNANYTLSNFQIRFGIFD